jgi:2,3-bisphosphoglycerate-dependent phosphoglycerate mutase
MELYIIRHGQSTNNALTSREDRGCDPPLTDLGRRQAALLAQHMAEGIQRSPDPTEPGYGITHLYCSPMWRALQTAQSLGETLGLVPEVWIDIHEWGGIYLDHGETGGAVGYPGKTRSEILDEFPNYVLPEGITEEGWWNQGREDKAGCIARAVRVAQILRERIETEVDERIAIVTHAGFAAMLIKALLNHMPGDDVWYHHHNTAISRIEFSREAVQIRYLNRADHLPLEMIT